MFAPLPSGHTTLAPAPPDDIPTPCAARPPPSPVCVLKFVSFCVFVCARDQATNTAASKDTQSLCYRHPHTHTDTDARAYRAGRGREGERSRNALLLL
jgi:hypothetical protein